MRRPAFHQPGQAHELTFTCQNRFQFLNSNRTCEWLAESINAARRELHFDVWAYVFMPEHVHIIVYPREAIYDISKILKVIKEPVGRKAVAYLRETSPEWLQRIAVRHGRRLVYRFWLPGGGYDRDVIHFPTLHAMIDYIHANPVRRGLAKQAEDWKWSSASWLYGKGNNSLILDKIDTGGLDLLRTV